MALAAAPTPCARRRHTGWGPGGGVGQRHARHCCVCRGAGPARRSSVPGVGGRHWLKRMCGIVGYVGHHVDGKAQTVVMEGLARLEYRGYDSAGIALVCDGGVETERAGKLENLRSALDAYPLHDSRTGIGHTRWATHGGPTDGNAHPHRGGDGDRLALIHNGIIENFHSLKKLLAEGVEFLSETDTEVAAKLVGREYDKVQDLTAAMRGGRGPARGCLHPWPCTPTPRCRRRRPPQQPLVVGLGEGENFMGSDVAAFIGYTRHALELAQDQIVTITPDSHDGDRLRRLSRRGASASRSPGMPARPRRVATTPSWPRRSPSNRTPSATRSSVGPRTTAARPRRTAHLGGPTQERQPDHLRRVWHRGILSLVAKYAIEHWTRIPVDVVLAHEFRYSDPIVDERTLVVSVSQSGETMDTLMAVKHARDLGA